MAYRFAQARIEAGLTLVEPAVKMNVDKTTISNWEAGRRQPTLEKLIAMSEILGFSVAYLLGIDEQIAWAEPIDKDTLPILHQHPVWTEKLGWALVNAAEKSLVLADRKLISFSDIKEPVYAVPPTFALGLRGIGEPLGIDEILSRKQVWVEPISKDHELAGELCGWYRPDRDRLVENEFGSRFYLDTYGSKWLAFETCIEESRDRAGMYSNRKGITDD